MAVTAKRKAVLLKAAAKAFPAEAPHEAAFTITATQSSRPPRTLKYGDTFVVLDNRGDIGVSSGGSAGLFHLDTRYLSRLELLVDQMRPLLLGSNIRDDNSTFFVDMTNPDLMSDQRIVLQKDTVHILRTIFLWRGTAYQRLAVRNYGDGAIDLRLSILFGNDFADLFEVRGSHRQRRGSATAKLSGNDQVLLSYQRTRREGAAHHAELRSSAGAACNRRRHLRPSPRSRRDATALSGRKLRSNSAASAAFPSRPHCDTP